MSRHHAIAVLAIALSWLAVSSADAGERMDRYGDPLPPGAVARMGSVLFFHGLPPSTLAFSPVGGVLAVSGESGNQFNISAPFQWHNCIRLLDATTGKELRRLPGHKATLALHFTSDGRRLISNGYDPYVRKSIKIWDTATGKELHRLQGDLVTPDGQTLIATASEKNTTTIRFSDVATGKERRRITIAHGRVWDIVSAPDGRTLVGYADDAFHIWDAATGRDLHRLQDSKSRCWLAYSPNGKMLAIGSSDKMLRLWDVASGKELHRWPFPGHSNCMAAFSPDGKLLAVPEEGGIIRLWDVGTGKEKGQIAIGDFARLGMAFSPDGRTLAYGGQVGIYQERHRIHLWDLTSGKERPAIGRLPESIENLAFSPDGKMLSTANRGTGTLHFWETGTGKEAPWLKGADRYAPIAFSPSWQMFAWEGNRFHLWDLASKQEIAFRGASPRKVEKACFSPDGRLLFIVENKEMQLWETATAKKLRSLGQLRHPAYSDIAFTADSKTLLVWKLLPDPEFQALDLTKGKPLSAFPLAEILKSFAAPPAFSPDGRHIAVVSRKNDPRFGERRLADVRIELWNLATSKKIHELRAEISDVKCLAFSPDGRSLAAVYEYGGIIRLWETATGQQRRKFDGHRQIVRCLAFSADGSLLATGSDDRTALVWDLTGRLDCGAPGSRDLSAEQQRALWEELASKDAAIAYRAMCRLIAGKQTPALLRQQLHPIAPLDDRGRRQLRQWIADLDSPQFDAREKATKELTRLGDLAEAPLRAVLADKPSPELRRRVEPILAQLDPTRSPKLLRMLRAIEVLEQMASPQARELLRSLAGGAAEARLTREAKASLHRLLQRHKMTTKENARGRAAR